MSERWISISSKADGANVSRRTIEHLNAEVNNTQLCGLWVIECPSGRLHEIQCPRFAQPNVNTRFRIEQGTGEITRTGNMGGSCEDIDMDLDAVYREAIDMARVVVAAMDGYTSDATVRASLFTFFGIQEDESTHTVSAGSAARFSWVKANLQEVIDDS